MAKKPGKTKSGPILYDIRIEVKGDGNFYYYLPDGTDASTIRPCNNDTVQWSLKVKGRKQPFTVEFPDYGPFGIRHRVVRSFGGPTVALPVSVSPLYRGNLAMKYIVTLANGWSDDPDIVPVPYDSMLPQDTVMNPAIFLSLDNSGLDITSPLAGIYAGEVTWKWEANVHGSDDFDLKFDAAVAGWPLTASSNGTQQIVLNLPTGSSGYTITLENLGLSKKSSLNVLS
jgi:hypothetical protein